MSLSAREIMDRDRARFGLKPITDEHWEDIVRAAGREKANDPAAIADALEIPVFLRRKTEEKK